MSTKQRFTGATTDYLYVDDWIEGDDGATVPWLYRALSGVTPCDGGGRAPCGSRTRLVLGFGVRVAGMVDLSCPRCGERSVMRPETARELGWEA